LNALRNIAGVAFAGLFLSWRTNPASQASQSAPAIKSEARRFMNRSRIVSENKPMAFYIVAHDRDHQHDRSHTPIGNDNYTPIWNTLREWGAHRLAEGLWVLTSESPALQIRDALYQSTGRRDTVVVIELKPGSLWATSPIVPEDTLAWLRENIMA
jgi:hypothetical protein